MNLFRSSGPSSGRSAAEAAIAAGLDIGHATHGTVVFLPGFLVTPLAYRALLDPVAEAGHRVVVPRLYRRGPRALAGRCSPVDEASGAATVVQVVSEPGRPCVLGGHSRGGYAAWLAATEVGIDGLILVDPVSGGGPPWNPARPLPPLPSALPVLVVGAGLGGRCAPAGRNHEQFVAAAPQATHAVVDDCGHADVLDGLDARVGQRLCRGASNPVAAREQVSALLTGFLRAPGAA